MANETLPAEDRRLNSPVFFGFLAVGFLAMLAGIAMFIYVVPKDMESGSLPKDVGFFFMQVYSQQIAYKNEKNRFAASLGEVNVERGDCDRYNCRLTTSADGTHYFFRLSKGGHTWAIEPNHPVPVEVK